MSVEPPSSDAARLRCEVTEGPGGGEEIAVEGELVIGRQAAGIGRLGDDPEISRRHARIVQATDDSYEIEDLGSSNGTFVNGELVRERVPLSVGDTIAVGGSALVVRELIAPAPSRPGALSLHLDFDTDNREAHLALDPEGDRLTFVVEDGRWTTRRP